jgi:ornithine cyclodeaminase/alanine dehydrogenase-like protein (mu-crystallin family)
MGQARNGRKERRSLGSLTLILSEKDVRALLDMDEVVAAVEEAFRREGSGEAVNSMRTRSAGDGSVLNVMHANLSYLRRGGLKAYMSSRAGTKFTLILYDNSTSIPLAVMGADHIGRYRTGAASGVATRHLFGRRSGKLAVMGSGKQAITQALAARSVMSVDEVRVWSPNSSHRDEFASSLAKAGFNATPCSTPESAVQGVDVVSSITSSKEAFITEEMVRGVSHVNICGGNVPSHAEMTTGAVGSFDTVVVDDLPQAKVEYGDLTLAAKAGAFTWESAVELGSVVAGKVKPEGRTLFKSGGAAIEDVAVANMLYEKAMSSGNSYPSLDLV